ncbi:MAG: hypothetical protein [Circular genetic element sp.]|nr:MAG: hypothetical protein [Circular genetic element sp.]
MPRYPRRRALKARRTYRRKPYNKRRAITKRRGGRLQNTIVTRVPTMRPRSALQKCIYYNTFICKPSLSNISPYAQQLYGIRFMLNNPWPFGTGWDALATYRGQTIIANEAITPLDVTTSNPADATTIIPGIRTSGFAYDKYANGTIIGSKTIINASAITNDSADVPQLAYLVTRKHSNVNDLTAQANITDLKKYPFLQMRKLNGGLLNTKQLDARIVVTHSPKKFNNIKDYRDNPQMSFKTINSVEDSVGKSVSEKDFLSIYVIPAINDYTPAGSTIYSKATNFMMTLRHEVSILWTEPKTDVEDPENFAYPIPAGYGGGFANSLPNPFRR